MYQIYIIHSLIYGHLDYFHFLAILNRVTVNMDEQVSLQ